eukprot:m.12288 g.12288  ORF g.12288 m.12288 type:complete len:448 (-) comp17397_c0_seq1:85-1428(-)
MVNAPRTQTISALAWRQSGGAVGELRSRVDGVLAGRSRGVARGGHSCGTRCAVRMMGTWCKVVRSRTAFFTTMQFIVLLLAAGALAQWKAIDTDLETFDTGIDFASDLVGFTAGDDGSGPSIYKTIDGGNTWNSVNATFGIDVMLLDIATSGQTVVVSGVFGNYYSTDGGNTFSASKGEYGPSQSVRPFGVDGNENFGVAGEFLEKNGVAISTNAGKIFVVDTIPLYTAARYGAYPTESTWYISAGEWPNNSEDSPLRRFELQDNNGKFPRTFDLKGPNSNNLEGNGYKAELVRTTDAGKTWTRVVAVNNTYYFNGIDCDPNNADHCCAVAEAFDITNAGAHILCTQDGVHWNETFFEAQNGTHSYSLMEVRFSNSTYLWAVGAVLGQIPSALFLRSDDGGQSWYQGSPLLVGLYAMSLASPSTSTSYASVDNTSLQKSGVAKYTAP